MFYKTYDCTWILSIKLRRLKIIAARLRTLTLGRNLKIHKNTSMQVLWAHREYQITNYPTIELLLKKEFFSSKTH